MKTLGNIESTANIIYAKQIFQSAPKINQVVIDTVPSVYDTVKLDCNFGNVQSIDLSNATASNVNVQLSNQNIGTYVLSIKQHSTIVRNLSFTPSVKTTFDMISVGISEYAVIVIHYDGTNFVSNSITTSIQQYSQTKNYGIGAITIYNNSLYRSNVQINQSAFVESNWTLINQVSASQTSYTDVSTIGATNVQTAIDYLVNKQTVQYKQYSTIDLMLADSSNQTVNHILLVDDVAAGSVIDTRVTSGYAYYQKPVVSNAALQSYNLIGAQIIPSDVISFDNTISNIQNNPTTVKSAIDELAALVDSLVSGQKYIDVWNAHENQRFISDNAFYDDLTKNPIINQYNATTKKATVLTSDFPSTVIVGSKIRIINASTLSIIHETVVSSIAISGLNTIVGLSTDTGVIQGHKIITANKKALNGDYLVITAADLTTNTTIDANSIWAVNDKIISNGTIWTRLANASGGIAEAPSNDIKYVRQNNQWIQLPEQVIDNALSQTSTNPLQNDIVTQELSTKLTDAPVDTKQYARKDGQWSEIIQAKQPIQYSYALSMVSATGVMSLHIVNPNGTIANTIVLDQAFLGFSVLSKPYGWTSQIKLINDNLVILYSDLTTSELQFLVFYDFLIDENNASFTYSSAVAKSTTHIEQQFTDSAMLHHIDEVFIISANTPTTITKYDAYTFIELDTITLPNSLDFNNASQARIYLDRIIFVAGANAYSGYVRISSVKLDFSAYEKLVDVTVNNSANTLPASGMLIDNGYLYLVQSSFNKTSFYLLKYDVRDLYDIQLIANVQHNYTAGNLKGLTYGLVAYGQKLYSGITWIGGATSSEDRQLWSFNMHDLSVDQKLTTANWGSGLTISSNGRLIWITDVDAYIGDSVAKLYSLNPSDLSQAATTLIDMPATERFMTISERLTSKDILRQNGFAPQKRSTTIQLPGIMGNTLYHDGTTWVTVVNVNNFQYGNDTTEIVLPDTPLLQQLYIFRNGIKQRIGIDFSIDANIITFITNPVVLSTETVEATYIKI